MNTQSKIEKKINSEYELVRYLIAYLELKQYQVLTEIPSLGQSVDIAAYKGKYLTFIEAKVSDWLRAIQQCNAHQHAADYIYIAIASVKVSDNLIVNASSKGLGVLHCNPYTLEIKEVLSPKLNRNFWKPLRTKIRNNIREIAYAN